MLPSLLFFIDFRADNGPLKRFRLKRKTEKDLDLRIPGTVSLSLPLLPCTPRLLGRLSRGDKWWLSRVLRSGAVSAADLKPKKCRILPVDVYLGESGAAEGGLSPCI